MPRSSGRSSGSRPAPAARSAPAPQQTRSASTATHPAQPHAAAPAQSAGGGLFANMASTAAGVAVGSTVGHGISNMLFGSSAPAAAAPPPPAEYAQSQAQNGASCAIQAKDFTKCLDATGGEMSACSYYLEALKSCQAAAAQY